MSQRRSLALRERWSFSTTSQSPDPDPFYEHHEVFLTLLATFGTLVVNGQPLGSPHYASASHVRDVSIDVLNGRAYTGTDTTYAIQIKAAQPSTGLTVIPGFIDVLVMHCTEK
ncbi:hypothetical protein Hypma_014968 [Hypsizygus marmoreus]|uniref:Uncharacterized protein n=1 Tax=Hypsizygus marmoreus TaxID=39966 RepID=A0A369K2D1_HYPMA|nr:hypothetical protein Hypma_014968 [Hypsizygus marmoreus]